MGQKNSINKSNKNDESISITGTETFTNECHDIKSPAVNANHRGIIRDCFDKASGITAGRIIMRVNQQRPDFKTYKDNLTPEQIDAFTNLLNDYLSAVVENIDDIEKVKELSMNYGLKHVGLRTSGFKPDFFAALADAIATECSFLSETATTNAPTNTFKAWTILVDLMFSSVRDGFYQELRRQRRHSPTHLKSLRESSTSIEQILKNSGSNLKDCMKLGSFIIHFNSIFLANYRSENDHHTNKDQAITARKISLSKPFSTTSIEEQEIGMNRRTR
uniref:GLOBIN domain-containing protein n=1 Tax=Loa loa TaxID=7209 RepID=A0A1I7W1R4_LOALO